MSDDRAALIRSGDLAGAIGLLTRLPFGGPGRGGAGAWAWPVVGALVGALAVLAGWLALWVGLPVGWAAALVLAVQAGLTGALHEDGLADTFDGLAGGRDRQRRLDIMRDSRIGTFGALALLWVGLARWSALVALLPVQPLAVIAVAALSRGGMAVLMAALPHARADGLARRAGRPNAAQAGLALVVAAALASLCADRLWLLLPALALVLLGLGLWARARIGGQTGDILGAAQQLGEAALLGILAATP